MARRQRERESADKRRSEWKRSNVDRKRRGLGPATMKKRV